MKISKYLFAFIISLGGVGSLVPSAEAGYTCSENLWGDTECTGTINGKRVNTTTTTNLWGDRETTGTIGGERFSETCSENLWGDIECN